MGLPFLPSGFGLGSDDEYRPPRRGTGDVGTRRPVEGFPDPFGEPGIPNVGGGDEGGRPPRREIREPAPERRERHPVDPALEVLRARLRLLGERGLGARWLRETYEQMALAPSEQAIIQQHQAREAGLSRGFDESGFTEQLIRNLERKRQELLVRAWEGVRSKNEEIKQQAIRQLTDLDEFYRRLREQGRLADAEFFFRLREAEDAYRREIEEARNSLYSGLARLFGSALSGFIATGGNPMGAAAGAGASFFG